MAGDSEFTQLDKIGAGNRNPVQETQYQALLKAQGGGSSSAGNFDLNAGVNAANAMRSNDSAFLAGQNGATNDFLGRYTGAINAQPTMSAMASKIGDELNLPTLRSNANTLNTTFANLPSTYGAATRGYDVNNNQLSRIIGQKSTEMAPAMTTANNALTSGENQLSTRLGYATEEQKKQLLPYQSEQQMLSDRLAREASMYSAGNQRELDAIIAKMNAGVTLSQGEAERANKLAIAEEGYQNAKTIAEENIRKNLIVGYHGEVISRDANGNVVINRPDTGGGVSGTGVTGGNVLTPPDNRPPLTSFYS